MPISIIRPFNTYGPRQSARAFIPTVITQIKNNQKDNKTWIFKTNKGFFIC